MRGCASTFHGQENPPTTRMWNRSTEPCEWSAWTRIGSLHSRTQKRSSKPGAGNTTRVALKGLTGNGRPTRSLVYSRLAANTQAQPLPETHSQDEAEKGDRSTETIGLQDNRDKSLEFAAGWCVPKPPCPIAMRSR